MPADYMNEKPALQFPPGKAGTGSPAATFIELT